MPTQREIGGWLHEPPGAGVKNKTYRARRVHRWLGLFIGIQFVLWTAGGLYFSWTKLDDVHGDHLVRPQPMIGPSVPLVSPAASIAALRTAERIDSIVALDLANVAGRPTYRMTYVSSSAGKSQRKHRFIDAVTGALREPVSRGEAIATAQRSYAGTAAVTRVDYLTVGDIGKHHEYREQPLPAWAVRFGDDEGATLYIPTESGQVHRVRNNRWRIFDFLWMLHTMDYEGRDDFNNLILRSFSVLGLITVSSGLLLFVLTSRPFRRRQRAKALSRQSGFPPHDTGSGPDYPSRRTR